MIQIKKVTYSKSLERKTVLGEKLKFNKDIEKDYVNNGYAEFIKRTTKELKEDIKTK